MILDPRIPEPVKPIIEDYRSLTEHRLVGLIDASYVVGSIALGEFNERFSDIDFITVLNRRVTSAEIEHLRKVHQIIEKTYPQWRMSGSYVQLPKILIHLWLERSSTQLMTSNHSPV